MSKEKVTLSPIRGDARRRGDLGDLKVDLKGGFRYTTDLAVKGAQRQDAARGGEVGRGLLGHALGQGPLRGQGRARDDARPGQRGRGVVPRREQPGARAARGRAAGARAREPRLRDVPRRVQPDREPLRDAGGEAHGRRRAALGTRQREPRHERPRLRDDAGPLAQAVRQDHAPRAARGLQAGRAAASRRSTSASTARRSSPRPTSLARVGKAAATGVAKDQVNKLLKTKIF